MNSADKRSHTIFCDIDGTLVTHSPPTTSQLPTHKLELLEGTIEKILEWDKLGYRIKDVRIKSNLAGPKKRIVSDLNMKADISIRDNKTIIRYLDLQITSDY